MFKRILAKILQDTKWKKYLDQYFLIKKWKKYLVFIIGCTIIYGDFNKMCHYVLYIIDLGPSVLSAFILCFILIFGNIDKTYHFVVGMLRKVINTVLKLLKPF
jgi:hypothetical protein